MSGKAKDRPSKCRLDKDEAALLFRLACCEAAGRISKAQKVQLNDLLLKLKAKAISVGRLPPTTPCSE